MSLPLKIIIACAGSVGILFMGAVMTMASQQWLLVNVDTHGPDGVNLYIPVPMGLVYPSLHFIPEEARVIEIPEEVSLNREAMLQMVDVIRDCPDGDFVRVETRTENVRIAKEGSDILVLVQTEEENVDIRIPLDFFDEMLQSIDGNKIYTADMASAFATIRHSRFLSVKCPDADVTIWSW
jgi:hypothetical protein